MELSLLEFLIDADGVGIAFLSFDTGSGKRSLLGISNFHFDMLWLKLWER